VAWHLLQAGKGMNFAARSARTGLMCINQEIRKKINDIVFLIPETYNIRTELKQKEGVPDE
jgi:hypothetical protein